MELWVWSTSKQTGSLKVSTSDSVNDSGNPIPEVPEPSSQDTLPKSSSQSNRTDEMTECLQGSIKNPSKDSACASDDKSSAGSNSSDEVKKNIGEHDFVAPGTVIAV